MTQNDQQKSIYYRVWLEFDFKTWLRTLIFSFVFGWEGGLSFSFKSFYIPVLSFNLLCTLELVKKFLWCVCKPILVFYFGPNQAFGLDWDQAEQLCY